MRKIWGALSVTLLLANQAAAKTLEVGPDHRLKTLAKAVSKSKPGDTILLAPGTYENDFAVIRHALTIQGDGGKARLLATRPIPNGKGILVQKANLTIENLIFEGANVRDQNGAGIRHQGGALVVNNCIFRNNENGILSSSSPSGQLEVWDSLFEANGFGDGYTHGIYAGHIHSVTVSRTAFLKTKVGHHLKSRAAINAIGYNFFDDGDVGSSYSIDLPNGGSSSIFKNYIVQGPNPENPIFISYGTRKLNPVNSLDITENTFINLAKNGLALRNKSEIEARFNANTLIGPLKIMKGNGSHAENERKETATKALLTYDTWLQSLSTDVPEP